MQNSIGREVSASGIGLHNGKSCSVTLKPAAPGSGVVFRDTALPEILIPAHSDFVAATRNRTVLRKGDASVATVEHLLAALYAASVDNCLVEVAGGEVPALDGSARPFTDMISVAGVVRQGFPALVHSLAGPVWIDEGDRYIIALPSSGLRISYAIDFAHPAVGCQSCHHTVERELFVKDIAPARTFGFEEDMSYFSENGLALGSCPENTTVFFRDGGVGRSLRYPDEAVRHKVLDLIGDFSLVGRRVNTHLVCSRGGHSLHLELVRRMVDGFGARSGGTGRGPEVAKAFDAFRRRVGLAL